MQYTTNLGLKKPEDADFGSNDDFNYNAEIIDSNIHSLNTQIGDVSLVLDAINGEVI